MELLLTDDELVAVAVEQSKAWPTGLPTVDVADERALLTAALRGRRSLAVRGLVGPAVAGNEVLDAVGRNAVAAERFVCLYVRAVDGTRAADSVNVNAYPHGAGWLAETVSDIGVHQFAPLSTAEFRTLCHGLAQAAFDRGLAGRTADALLLAVVLPDRQESITVRKGVVRRSEGEGPGGPDPGAEVDRLLSMTAQLNAAGSVS
jgi:hypothetical protein